MSGQARDHERFREELAGYAVGALSPGDAAAFERHLAECSECREELEWLRPAVDALPGSVPQLAPPPALRDRVMAAVAEEPDAPRAPAASPRREKRRWRGLLLRPAGALATTALLAVGVIGGYALRGEDSDPTVVAAEPAVLAPRGEVAAALERAESEAVLHVARLPRLRPGRAYQVWIERGGQLEPSTVFTLAGDQSAEVSVEEGLEGAARLLVTEEPARGSARPTTAPILTAALG